MSDVAKLTMTISPAMEKDIVDVFNLEVEVMKGVRMDLEDGMVKIIIEISDEQKIAMVKDFVLKMISESPNKNLN